MSHWSFQWPLMISLHVGVTKQGSTPSRCGDQLAGVGVVAGHLVRGQLVRRALRVRQPLRALHEIRLRRIGRIGRQDERAAREDLRELVGRRIAGRVPSRPAARAGAREDQRADRREHDRRRPLELKPMLHLRSSFRRSRQRRESPEPGRARPAAQRDVADEHELVGLGQQLAGRVGEQSRDEGLPSCAPRCAPRC